jgi:hypothetical protein
MYNNDDIKLELQPDDIYAVQSLVYGYPEKQPEATVSSSVAETLPDSPPTKTAVCYPKLCDMVTNLRHFLIVNQFMYVFHEKWFWMIDIRDMSYNEPPQLITDWLMFLPNGFKSVSGIYQRPSGEIAIFVGDHLYMMEFPSLRLVIGYPKHVTAMGIGQKIKFNAVVNAYTGKTSFYFIMTITTWR